MIIKRKIPFRTHGKKPPIAPPVVGPVLVQAIYPVEDVIGAIDLVFDRAINIDALDGTQIIVKDGVFLEATCDCTGPAELVDPQTVRLFLVGIGDYFEPNQLLDATGASGIVASDDGGMWAGVTELSLPFPTPLPGEIVAVSIGADVHRVVANVNQAVSAIDNVASALQVSIDGTTWLTPIGMDTLDPINIVFIFSVDVSAATQWRVQDGSVWHFVDGQELGEPFAGTIE